MTWRALGERLVVPATRRLRPGLATSRDCEGRLSGRLLPARRQVDQQAVERGGAGTGNREPHEGGEIGRFLEPEQRLQRVDVTPFRGLDRDDHDNREHRRRDAGEQAQDQHHAAEAFDAGYEGGEDGREGNAPAREVLGDLGEVGELAPAGQHEGVADDDPHEQWTGPGKVRGDPRRQQDQQVDDEIHAKPLPNISLCRLRRRSGRTASNGTNQKLRPRLGRSFAGRGQVVTPLADILQRREGFQQPDADARHRAGQEADAGDHHQHPH
ncbi:hypothetical protein chiPu_0028657, partial [Chiloscyllium punctatum]|nr:hypothetical protein [Chiloscyllium punctatum]